MIRKLVVTDNDIATTILRLVLGVIFFAHGAQKMLGWFGGYGFTGTMGFFTGVLHIPAVFAFLAIAAEFFGGLGLIFGLFTRVASLGVFCNMIVAVAMVHGRFGFWMNWTGAQKGEGYEYHLLLLAASALLMIRGAGAASLDRLLSFQAKSGISTQTRPLAA
jgi:putative oxidoreductase